MTSPSDSRVANNSGMSLIELLFALSVLTLGVLALVQLFPTASRAEAQDRMRTVASQCMRDEIERLQALEWTDAALSAGRHPAGNGVELVHGTDNLGRYYDVAFMPAPLANLKRVTVSTTWQHSKPCTLQSVTYISN